MRVLFFIAFACLIATSFAFARNKFSSQSALSELDSMLADEAGLRSQISQKKIDRALTTFGIAKREYDEIMQAAKRGTVGAASWWERLKKAIVAGFDKLNVVKWWECNRCDKCLAVTGWFESKIRAKIDEVINEVEAKIKPLLSVSKDMNLPKTIGDLVAAVASGTGVTSAVCYATVDLVALGLCVAVTAPIPIPGSTPLICAPFTWFVHTKCKDFLGSALSFMTEKVLTTFGMPSGITPAPQVTAFLGKINGLIQKVKQMTTPQLLGFDMKAVCGEKYLGLCPLTRTDCAPKPEQVCYEMVKGGKTYLYTPAVGDCVKSRANDGGFVGFWKAITVDTFATCEVNSHCKPSEDEGGCEGLCHCSNYAGRSALANICLCLEVAPEGFNKCDETLRIDEAMLPNFHADQWKASCDSISPAVKADIAQCAWVAYNGVLRSGGSVPKLTQEQIDASVMDHVKKEDFKNPVNPYGIPMEFFHQSVKDSTLPATLTLFGQTFHYLPQNDARATSTDPAFWAISDCEKKLQSAPPAAAVRAMNSRNRDKLPAVPAACPSSYAYVIIKCNGFFVTVLKGNKTPAAMDSLRTAAHAAISGIKCESHKKLDFSTKKWVSEISQ